MPDDRIGSQAADQAYGNSLEARGGKGISNLIAAVRPASLENLLRSDMSDPDRARILLMIPAV